MLRNLILSREYTLVDRINFFRRISQSVDALYPELVRGDLFVGAPIALSFPVYATGVTASRAAWLGRRSKNCGAMPTRSAISESSIRIARQPSPDLLSGIHATVAGVLLAFAISVRTRLNEREFLSKMRRARGLRRGSGGDRDQPVHDHVYCPVGTLGAWPPPTTPAPLAGRYYEPGGTLSRSAARV